MLLLRLDRAEKMSAIDAERATQRRTALWHNVRRFFERYDVLVTPTTSVAAFPIGQTFPAEIDGRPLTNQLEWFPFTYPFAITGQPAISVPGRVHRRGVAGGAADRRPAIRRRDRAARGRRLRGRAPMGAPAAAAGVRRPAGPRTGGSRRDARLP